MIHFNDPDAQKGLLRTRPPRRAKTRQFPSMAAGSENSEAYFWGYVEEDERPRTPLEAFFSVRLGVVPDDQRINLKLRLQTASSSLSLLLRSKTTDMDPIATPSSQLDRLHSDIRILTPQPTCQELGIGRLSKGRHLDTKVAHGPWSSLIGCHPNLNLVCPCTDHAEGLGASLRQIQNSILGKGAPVVHPDSHRSAARQRSDLNHRTEGKGPVRSGQLMHVVGFTVGRFAAVKPRAIPGGHAPLCIPDRIAGSGNMAWHRSRLAAVEEKRRQETGENQEPPDGSAKSHLRIRPAELPGPSLHRKQTAPRWPACLHATACNSHT